MGAAARVDQVPDDLLHRPFGDADLLSLSVIIVVLVVVTVASLPPADYPFPP